MLSPASRSVLRCRSVRTSGVRYASSTYHSKVRAFEFAVSLEEILSKLKLYTAVYLWRHGKTSSRRMGLIQHLVEIAMSDSPNPSSPPLIWVGRTQAVYLPAWLIDASIFAKAASTTSRGTEPALATVTSQNSYFPGFAFAPLSSMALGAGLEDVLAVPFSDKLRTQFGQEITCIPFKFAPFDLVSVLRSFGTGKFPPQFDVDFSSARVNMMAAYPVLVPVYLVEFNRRSGEDVETYTVVCQAATPGSPYIIDDYAALEMRCPSVAKKLILPFIPSPFLRGLRAMRSFANLSCGIGTTVLIRRSRAVAARLSGLMNRLAAAPSALGLYESTFFKSLDESTGAVTARPIDWDDLRIRPYTNDECVRNRLWAELDSQVQLFRWSVANNGTQGKYPILGDIFGNWSKSARDMQEDARPEWLTKWYARPNKKNDGFT